MLVWRIFSLVSLSIWSSSPTSSYEASVRNYIETYQYKAIDEMHRTGIPASITLAQGIHESQAGKSPLALEANNHFGIKCKSYWTGDTYYHPDDDYDEVGVLTESCFRSYENAMESYRDHSDFLRFTKHYQSLFNLTKTDYVNWAKGLKKCGYATDERYAYKLIQTIENYQLNEFDHYVIKYE